LENVIEIFLYDRTGRDIGRKFIFAHYAVILFGEQTFIFREGKVLFGRKIQVKMAVLCIFCRSTIQVRALMLYFSGIIFYNEPDPQTK
jgi:hypothetical protein